ATAGQAQCLDSAARFSRASSRAISRLVAQGRAAMSDRNAFLARVRQAAEQGRQYRVHLMSIPDDIGYLGAGDNLVERFASEVNAVGGQAYVVPDLQAARRRLKELLTEAGAISALCWRHPLLDRLDLAELLSDAGVTLLDQTRLAGM